MTRELRDRNPGGQFADAMNDSNTKTPVESKTLWGAAALLLSWLLGQLGADTAAAEISGQLGSAAEAVQVLLGVGGFCLTVYGRVTAARKIRLSGK